MILIVISYTVITVKTLRGIYGSETMIVNKPGELDLFFWVPLKMQFLVLSEISSQLLSSDTEQRNRGSSLQLDSN